MNQQMHWLKFIYSMKMNVRKTICWIKKNESANGLTQLHTIYENDFEENDLLNKKKWISKWIDSTSYIVWKWMWGKRIAE
jgi:hypothetical protein